MQHCQKLVLVPQDTLTRMHEKPATRTTGDVMNDLDKEMSRILQQKAADSEKWNLYEQALQKYLYFVNEQKKPATHILPETNTSENGTDDAAVQNSVLKEKLLYLIPQKFKKSAAALYEHLSTSEAKNFIRWDANGIASVGGEEFASIIDLISDAVRTRQKPKVTRWQAFASVLKSLHTPIDIIGNQKYVQALQAQGGSGLTVEQNFSDSINTNTSRHKHSRVIKSTQNDKQKKNKGRLSNRVTKTKWKRWA